MSTSHNFPVFTAVIKLSVFADAFVRQSAGQYHGCVLNKLPFSTWRSCELSPFIQVNDLFLLLQQGSSHQFSCGCLQLYQKATSTIRGETGMNKNTSWWSFAQPQKWSAQSFFSFGFHNQSNFHLTSRPLLIAHAILIRTLPCFSVTVHLHCSSKRHDEIQLSSSVLWVIRSDFFIVMTWAVMPTCWEPLRHQLLEMLLLKHIWRICSNTEIVSYSATSLSVPEDFCTLCALWEYSQDLPSYFFLLGSLSIRQWPYVGLPRCTILIVNRLSNELIAL